jgi:hypothetical protein
MSDFENVIKEMYYSTDEGFVGVDKLYRKLRQKGYKVTKAEITKVLKKQEVYQKTKKNNQKRNSFISRYPHQEYQIDLIYIQNPHLNDGKYGLSAIDTFTRKGAVILLKDKTAKSVVEAIKKAFDELGGKPTMVYTDEGSEFKGETIKYLKQNGVQLIVTYTHATFVERFNRTIKEMMEKYLESTKTKAISQVLPKIVKNYNNSFHSGIGMAPNEVNKKNMHIVQERIIKKAHRQTLDPIKVGDSVRIQLKDSKLNKGYKPKYSDLAYIVEKIEKPFYFIKDIDNRKFLRTHLLKISGVEKNIYKPENEQTREGKLTKARTTKAVHKFKEIEIPEPAVVNRPKRDARNRYVKTDFGTVLIE